MRRALFGFLGFYLGSLAGFFVFLPFGFGALVLMWLCGLAGAISVAAETPRVRRGAIRTAVAVTLVLYIMRLVSS